MGIKATVITGKRSLYMYRWTV